MNAPATPKGFGTVPAFKSNSPVPPVKPIGTPAPPVPSAPEVPAPPVVSAPEVPIAEVTTENTVEKKEKKERKPRVKSDVEINSEHIVFVRKNIKTMSYTDMSAALGITRNQINRILQTLKGGIDPKGNPFGLRGHAIVKSAENGEQAYALKDNNRPDFGQPLSVIAQEIEKLIDNELSRPAESRPGGGGRKGGGKVKEALEFELENLLSNLGN